jgi:WhiB family redox-sensing transcriptional regulator
VQVECLEFALATNQDSGIWGGTSEEERRAIRRHRAAAKAGTSVAV